jgi:hypothetical protein
MLMTIVTYLWDNRTKIMGLAQGTVAMIAGMDGVIPPEDVKYWLAASAVLTFWIGFGNGSVSRTTVSVVTPANQPGGPTTITTNPKVAPGTTIVSTPPQEPNQ